MRIRILGGGLTGSLAGSIVNPLQAETRGRHCWPSAPAIARRDDLGDRIRFESTTADFDQCPDHDSNHVIKESATRDINADDSGREFNDYAAMDGSHCALSLFGGVSEGSKVVGADHLRRG